MKSIRPFFFGKFPDDRIFIFGRHDSLVTVIAVEGAIDAR